MILPYMSYFFSSPAVLLYVFIGLLCIPRKQTLSKNVNKNYRAAKELINFIFVHFYGIVACRLAK